MIGSIYLLFNNSLRRLYNVSLHRKSICPWHYGFAEVLDSKSAAPIPSNEIKHAYRRIDFTNFEVGLRVSPIISSEMSRRANKDHWVKFCFSMFIAISGGSILSMASMAKSWSPGANAVRRGCRRSCVLSRKEGAIDSSLALANLPSTCAEVNWAAKNVCRLGNHYGRRAKLIIPCSFFYHCTRWNKMGN